MRSGRRRRREERGPSHDRWLVSYADFITLLFAFFTVLYASSSTDRAKLGSVAASVQHVFGRAAAEERRPTVLEHEAPRQPALVPPLDELRGTLERDLAIQIADRRVSLDADPRGLVISIREAGSFASGAADLPPATRVLFAGIAAALRPAENAIHVEGHTDDVPIQGGPFASNWELSTARATRVVDFLLQSGIDPHRLSAAGYAEFRPREPNDSHERRARNRRVDIVVMSAEQTGQSR